LQERLSVLLQRRFTLPAPAIRISGEVEGPKRQKLVDKFQARAGFDVALLSPRAAGVGLTLTAANHVIHLSRWWNPAVEDQATDRVYRIGQARSVTVHLPLAVHPVFGEASFDLRLDGLLERKRGISRDFLAPPEATKDDLEALFSETLAVGPSPGQQALDPTPADAPSPRPPPPPASRRPVLGLAWGKREPRNETPVQQRPAPSFVLPAPIEFKARQQRDLPAVFACLAGHEALRVTISDRYALAGDRHREGLTRAIKAMTDVIGHRAHLEIRFVDPEHLSDARESLGHQKYDFAQRLERLGVRSPYQLAPLPRRGSPHDREWTITLKSGDDAKHRIRINFSNSSDALATDLHRVLVVFLSGDEATAG
jgi:hypothetical protein